MTHAIYRFLVTFVAALALVAAAPAPTFAAEKSTQTTFKSAEQAMEAIAAALAKDDMKTLRAMLGPDGEAILNSGDPVEDKETRQRFTTAYNEAHKIDLKGNTAWIVVGKDDWPMPIPVVQGKDGWRFDTKAGREELLNRRVGRNELNTMQAVLAYIDAQNEYYVRNPENAPLLHYAQKFVSTKGKRDGLYFPTRAGEKVSPLGPLFDARHAAGAIQEDHGGKPGPYHGYLFRILKGQGKAAPGGAYDYVVRGKMIGGFAVIAYPATYGNSGVMTFIANQDGVIYEKDLGADTARLAQKIARFDPDRTWKKRDK
ncbi:MAG TPA: DUF2950 domain-containing protein [Burkholderiales bacterium]|nr:DUF2950 domain-containing protein [Burkholderiales bacterium]